MQYLIPAVFISVILFAAVKKINVYASFSRGVGEAVKFVFSLLPMLACVFIMCELMERAAITDALSRLLSPLLGAFGIPSELTKLILIKPFSGSGSLAYLTEILEEYGADCYIGRCACVLYGSSETVFYVSAVYFAKCKDKKRVLPIVIILFATVISTITACFICKFM